MPLLPQLPPPLPPRQLQPPPQARTDPRATWWWLAPQTAPTPWTPRCGGRGGWTGRSWWRCRTRRKDWISSGRRKYQLVYHQDVVVPVVYLPGTAQRPEIPVNLLLLALKFSAKGRGGGMDQGS